MKVVNISQVNIIKATLGCVKNILLTVVVIVEKQKGSDISKLKRKKFLVPKTFTLGQFSFVLRKRLQLESEKAMFMFINNELCSNTELMSNIYEKYKNKDHFLYITYSGENTFG